MCKSNKTARNSYSHQSVVKLYDPMDLLWEEGVIPGTILSYNRGQFLALPNPHFREYFLQLFRTYIRQSYTTNL